MGTGIFKEIRFVLGKVALFCWSQFWNFKLERSKEGLSREEFLWWKAVFMPGSRAAGPTSAPMELEKSDLKEISAACTFFFIVVARS